MYIAFKRQDRQLIDPSVFDIQGTDQDIYVVRKRFDGDAVGEEIGFAEFSTPPTQDVLNELFGKISWVKFFDTSNDVGSYINEFGKIEKL